MSWDENCFANEKDQEDIEVLYGMIGKCWETNKNKEELAQKFNVHISVIHKAIEWHNYLYDTN